ncbi:transporter substrate-binding domain-containing protein [Pseudoduganella sp. FT25W]|uniref:Transporter substrate-binding domain-containing protein n=2 Tax=Duganella alba TaxID=2666081 RepID=A0A6L5QCM3_9BURK|nr:transporter substrate-binding domain-containing protein [Duganella alba]MRX19452.1 transporter substrate-binding domain-containing protein [Duganella alba]
MREGNSFKEYCMTVVTRRRALAALGALPLLSVAAAPRQPLRLTMVNLMPWAGLDAQGQPFGALIDLSAQMAQLSGLPIIPIPVPYGRAPYMLRSGGSELMLAIDISPKGGTAIEHVGTVDIVVLGRDNFRFERLSDLHGKTVGHLRHAAYSPELEADQAIRKHAFDSYEQGVRMLLAGRFDAMMGVGDSIEYALTKSGGGVSQRYVLARGKVALYADASVGAGAAAALQDACKQLRQKHVMETLLKRPPQRR